jgi:zinc-ribbon domain
VVRPTRGQKGRNQTWVDPRTQRLPCPSCGLINEANARFCRNCGLPLGWPQDPVRGTTTARADLPSERGTGLGSIIGLVAALAIVAVAAYLLVRPGGVGNPQPGLPTPSSSAGAAASPTEVAVASPTTGTSSGEPSTSPEASASPGETPGPTETPEPTPKATIPPSIGYTCSPGTIADPTVGLWRVVLAHWSHSGSFDRITFDLQRAGDAGRVGKIRIESLSLDQVASTYGVAAPTIGDRAIVVTLDRRFSSVTISPHDTSLTIVPQMAMSKGSDGLYHAVLGAVGTGCHRVGVPEWTSDPTSTTAELNIDVKR